MKMIPGMAEVKITAASPAVFLNECARLGLPIGMTPNALLDAVNILYDKDFFTELATNYLTQEETP